MKRSLRIIDNLGKWSGQVIAPLALVYMTILVYEVIARYGFNAPTKWAHEISTFIFGAQFMLAGAYTFWRGSFVNVEIIHDRLPRRVAAIVDLVFAVFGVLVCVVIIWKAGDLFLWAVRMNEHSQTILGPPLYHLRGIIPVSAFLLLLQVVAKFTRDIYLAFTGKELK